MTRSSARSSLTPDGLSHAVAQHFAAAELALVAVDGVVALDFGDEIRVASRTRSPVVGP